MKMRCPATGHVVLPTPGPGQLAPGAGRMMEEVFLESRLAAVRGASRLSPEVLAIEGMSDAQMRRLLNNIGGRVRTYLEVGCYHGSTLIAAAYRNPRLWALGVDNFSQMHDELNSRGGPREQITDHIRRLAPHVRFVESDFRDVNPEALPLLDCFLYDGEHDRRSQAEAVVRFAPRFGPECLLLVDDWNFDDAREGTYDGLREIGDRFRVSFIAELCDTWNNVGVFVLQRREGASERRARS